MTTTTDEFREDAQFLREVTDKNIWAEDIRERLFRIANNVDMMANAMFTPSLQLEKQAEEWLTDTVQSMVAGNDPMDALLLGLSSVGSRAQAPNRCSDKDYQP